MATYDAWLSAALGKPAYHAHREVPENLAELCDGPVFIDAKPSVIDVAAHERFIRSGFRLVSTSVSFECREFKSVLEWEGSPDCEVRFADHSEESEITALASSAFKYDRFHMDDLIPDDIADRIKRKWVESFFCGQRGDWMVVAQLGGAIVGFLQLINNSDNALVVDLVAVKEAARGRGLAGRMLSFAAAKCKSNMPIFVGTQLANVASIALYEKLGFQMVAADHVFHLSRN